MAIAGALAACTIAGAGPIVPCDAWQLVMGTTAGAPSNEHVWTLDAISGETYTFTFCQGGGTAAYDTGLSIWNGAAQLICNDDSCGLLSEIIWLASLTGTVDMRLGGFGSATGTYTLAYRQVSPCTALNTSKSPSFRW